MEATDPAYAELVRAKQRFREWEADARTKLAAWIDSRAGDYIVLSYKHGVDKSAVHEGVLSDFITAHQLSWETTVNLMQGCIQSADGAWISTQPRGSAAFITSEQVQMAQSIDCVLRNAETIS